MYLYNGNTKNGDSWWKQVKYMYMQNECLLFLLPRTLFPKWIRLPMAGDPAGRGEDIHTIFILTTSR